MKSVTELTPKKKIVHCCHKSDKKSYINEQKKCFIKNGQEICYK